MTTHHLKTWPDMFNAVVSGVAPYQVRRDDRRGGFKVGDVLVLEEWVPSVNGKPGRYTGQQTTRVVTHVLPGPYFGISEGFVAMGIADPKSKGTAMLRKTEAVVLKCRSCGAEVLDKGEHPKWKGIPMAPNSAEMEWYCREKEPCEDAFQGALQRAESAWGGDCEAP